MELEPNQLNWPGQGELADPPRREVFVGEFESDFNRPITINWFPGRICNLVEKLDEPRALKRYVGQVELPVDDSMPELCNRSPVSAVHA